MKYFAYITHVPSGVTRVYPDNAPGSTVDDIQWIWEEGNYSCDCNRGLFFARVGGEHDPNAGCDGLVYTVKLTTADGTVLYEDG